MLRHGFAVIVAVLAVGLFAIGCGDDGDSGTDASGAGAAVEGSGKKAFVKKANLICEESLSDLAGQFQKKISNSNGDVSDPHEIELEFLSSQVVPTLESEVEEIRSLGMPSGDEDQVDTFLNSVEEVIDRAESDPEGFLRDREPYADSEKLAKAYGISLCPLADGVY